MTDMQNAPAVPEVMPSVPGSGFDLDAVPQAAGGHMAQVESSRAAQEVQAAMIVAQKFPRNENLAYARIMKSCERPGLANSALYQYPRGGQQIKGPSINLAKAMAKAYGNLDYGIRELEQRDGESVVESYCWDLETNVRETKVFTVPHERKARGKIETLTDPRDIYELVANMGSRRLRACILGIIPEDLTAEAVAACYKTMSGGSDVPLSDRIRKLVAWFEKTGVSQKMLEDKLGHEVSAIDETELVDLRMIANSLKDGAAKREDYFKVAGSSAGHAQNLNQEFPTSAAKEAKPKKEEPKK